MAQWQAQPPPATASKIRQAVKVLDYQPNAQARRLSKGRADTIGIIVPDISNPFFALIAERGREDRRRLRL